MPFCKRAGVEVVNEKSYDEWENIVQQYFDSFVLSIFDYEMGTHSISSFKKLGTIPGKNNTYNVVCAEYDDQLFFIDDIVSYDGISNTIEWISCSSAHKMDASELTNIISLEKFKNFSVSEI